MSNEMRVFGSPGTGKTTKLANEIIPMLAEKYGADKIMLTSFTKAAAHELGQRIKTSDAANIGTLHSMCYKALKHPALAQEKLTDWNKTHPHYSLMHGMKVGPALNAEYQVYRNKMVDRTKWKSAVLKFGEAWEKWKSKNHLLDFIDLIELAGGMLTPPGNPSVIVLDESQDFTRTEMSTLRRWATQCHEFWVCGDEDQCIYSFSGASPENMLLPELPKEQKIILHQSYRMPRTVHKLAETLIGRVAVREPKQYSPRDAEGTVTTGTNGYDNPEWVIKDALKRPGTSMIIASCNYMLSDLILSLQNKGIPFANPWRKEAKDWNPLETKGASILLNYLNSGEDAEYWSTSQFITWAQELGVGPNGLRRGQGKAGLKQLQEMVDDNPDTPGLHTCRDYIEDILSPDIIEIALSRDVRWLRETVTANAKRLLNFPARVLKKRGKEALMESPQLYIGTIHCSPPGELILTTNGYIPIEKLKSDIHTIPSYHRKTNNCFWGKGKEKTGYPITVGSREYEGELVTIQTTQSKTCVTPEHRLIVKFSKNFYNKYVVYLMRKGEWWRIGLCTSGHRPYKSGGITGRLATEQADCAWILKVCETRQEAFFTEQLFQTKYGISGVPFIKANGYNNSHMTTDQVQFIHESCKHLSLKRSSNLLSDIGQNIDYPLWTRHIFKEKHNIENNPRKKSMRGCFEIRAMNFLNGYMQVPVVTKSFINKEKGPTNRKPLLLIGFSSREKYNGMVYSISVSPYHYYISGGAVVHNSVKGAEADNVYVYPDISFASMREASYQEGYDNLCRLFYVGITRTKENLILMPPATQNFFQIK